MIKMTTPTQQKERNAEFKSNDVSMGYSNQIYEDLEYNEHGAMCAYEHCIEHMPLGIREESCPVFGHDCPGGIEQVDICKKEYRE